MKIAEIVSRYKKLILKLEGGINEFDMIISEVCGIDRFSLLLFPDKDINDRFVKKIDYIVKKRINNVPLSWLFKKHRFIDMDIFIKTGVFIPRPETEELAVMALKYSFSIKKPSILDFCAGSGAIGLYIAKKNRDANVFAVDRSKKAFYVMNKNKKEFRLSNFIPILSSKIDFSDLKFNIIVSNPPYIPQYMYDKLEPVVKKEPKSALISGFDGLDMIRYISRKLPKLLKPGGVFIGEIGEYYSDKVLSIFKKVSDNVEVMKDINKKDRYIKVVFDGMLYN